MHDPDTKKPRAGKAPRRECAACHKILPLTPKHFPRKLGHTHAFGNTCKSCKVKARQLAKMEEMETQAAGLWLESADRGGSSLPHTSELLECVMENFGGVRGFSNLLFKQYLEAAPGSRMRTSMLESITRLVVKASETGGTAKPVSLMTDDELEQAMAKKLENAVATHKNLQYIKDNPTAAAMMGMAQAQAAQSLEVIQEGEAVAKVTSR
jgi:hypothetical protein